MNTPLQKIGAIYDPAVSEFVVWAPLRRQVELKLWRQDGAEMIAMAKDDQGYWKTDVSALPSGTNYTFRLDGAGDLPDPASRCQPEGVHGPSQLVDGDAFSWTDEAWKGLPMSNMIIYELHTGCFSDTHDLDGVTAKLDYLAELGINAIELMPLSQFPGERNWGYDGVYPFSIQPSYGGPTAFKRLVDAAHARGIAVIIDVVYNHMGPEGNYLAEYGPYFTDKYHTPWGPALNFDDAWSDGIRNFFLQNARMWLDDLHVDGLRLDAVHAIRDFGARHFMQDLKELSAEIERRTDRKKVLIAEIDLNDPRYINPAEKGGYGLDGQWTDEFHHSLHSLLTGERNSYYSDFGAIGHLEKAFRHTYVYNGNWSEHRKKFFGVPADLNPYSQFVVFTQNHDHVGNRPLGDRLTATLGPEQLKLAAATVLLSPYIPLLFMGEEYGATTPFLFFVSFDDPELIATVRSGRRNEFGDFYKDHTYPDPESADTFRQSCLSWDHNNERSTMLLRYYKHLIGLRTTRPAMQGITRDSMVVHGTVSDTIHFERKILTDQLFVWLNFGAEPLTLKNEKGVALHKLFDSADVEWLGPGSCAPTVAPPDGDLILSPYSALVYEIKS